jgi:hypothetical protein
VTAFVGKGWCYFWAFELCSFRCAENQCCGSESEIFWWIRIRKKFWFGSNHKRVWKKMQSYIEIVINISTNRVITRVRTSILSVHLHEKRIADTLENLYFLYHLCRSRIHIRIRKKFLDPTPKNIFSDPQHCRKCAVVNTSGKAR